MAMFTSHHSNHPTTKTHSPFSAALSIVASGLTEIRASWRRRKNAELIQGLSPELRKDIGWPTSDIEDEANGSRHH